ncbi:MAG: hypothetical protein EOO71_00835 [Myxococcaceae bacterium]|nr:MAG: hypothetical protein EOO71_00835 [Myxococcaceae bacterium]
MRGSRSILSWAVGAAGMAGLLAACGPSVASERYVVEVWGSREAFERYTVQAEGLRDEGRATAGPQDVQRFSLEAEEGLLERAPVSFQSLGSDGAVTTVSLQPFVCRDRAEQYARLRKEGWRFTERHQLRLTDDGRLQRDTDLDRELTYVCEASPSSSGDSGEAWSTPLSTPGACDEPAREETRVVLESERDVRPARLCHATYLRQYGGAVHVGFSFPDPGSALPLTVSLWHCMDPVTAAYPVTLEVGTGFPASGCPRLPGASGLSGGEPASAPLLRGTWRITSVDFSDGGHLVGEVDAVFGVPGGSGELRLHGPVDLPLLRIPLPGGNGP